MIVSRHAIKRFKERCRGLFPASTFSDDRLIISMILGQVSKGIECFYWKLSPFYRNKIMSKHGDIRVLKRSGVFYVTARVGTQEIVKTCMTKFQSEEQ